MKVCGYPCPREYSGRRRATGEPEPPREFHPPDWIGNLLWELDQLLSPALLATLSEHGYRELPDSAEVMVAFERQVSDRRRRVHADLTDSRSR